MNPELKNTVAMTTVMDKITTFVELSIDLRLLVESQVETNFAVVEYLSQVKDIPREDLAA